MTNADWLVRCTSCGQPYIAWPATLCPLCVNQRDPGIQLPLPGFPQSQTRRKEP
jgi:hypothetical protein